MDKAKIRKALYYEKNKEAIKARTAQYFIENRETMLIKQREYWGKNKDRLNSLGIANQKKRYHDDLFWKAKRQICAKVKIAIVRGYTERSSVYKILGCDWNTVRFHIESQFKDGMNWDNRSEWDIDHKIPLSTATTEDEILRLWNHKNLQPLWPEENKSKGSRILPEHITGVAYLSANL